MRKNKLLLLGGTYACPDNCLYRRLILVFIHSPGSKQFVQVSIEDWTRLLCPANVSEHTFIELQHKPSVLDPLCPAVPHTFMTIWCSSSYSLGVSRSNKKNGLFYWSWVHPINNALDLISLFLAFVPIHGKDTALVNVGFISLPYLYLFLLLH